MEKNDGGGWPPGMELLWGMDERSERRSRQGLSLDRIVSAGVEIADAEGLGQLSMARVAERLGFTPMSLYRYVRSKEELLTLMADAATGTPPPESAVVDGAMAPGGVAGGVRAPGGVAGGVRAPGGVADGVRAHGGDDGVGGAWRPGLERWARDQLAVLRQHPWLLRIPISGPPLGPGSLAWMERGLSVLRGTGLVGGEAVGAIQLVSNYVRGEVQLSNELAAGAEVAARGGGEPASYGRMLAALVDPARFPALAELVAEGVFDAVEGYTDEDFNFGLQRILDGIEMLVSSRAESGR